MTDKIVDIREYRAKKTAEHFGSARRSPRDTTRLIYRAAAEFMVGPVREILKDPVVQEALGNYLIDLDSEEYWTEDGDYSEAGYDLMMHLVAEACVYAAVHIDDWEEASVKWPTPLDWYLSVEGQSPTD